MNHRQIQRSEIWAQLFLSDKDYARIRDFFVREVGIEHCYLARRMHLTVYHALGPMPGVVQSSENTSVMLAATDTRFMVMAPGGEVARPEIDPANRKVGIRVQKRSVTMAAIMAFRNRLIQFESKEVLGDRSPSTGNRSSFGAPHFQPHMTVLEAGSGVDRDLTPIGTRFRETIGDLTFDRFTIDVVSNDFQLQSWQEALLRTM